MAPRLSDVWLRLYQLAETFEARGSTHEDRVRVVLEELLTMPPELQQQSLERLELLISLGKDVAIRGKENTKRLE